MTNEKTFEQRLSEYSHEVANKEVSYGRSGFDDIREDVERGANWCKAEMQQEIDDLKAQYMAVIEQIKKALKFYADKNNWDEIWLDSEDGNDDNSGDCSCRIDLTDVELKKDNDGTIYYSVAGHKARQTLASIEQKLKQINGEGNK